MNSLTILAKSESYTFTSQPNGDNELFSVYSPFGLKAMSPMYPLAKQVFIDEVPMEENIIWFNEVEKYEVTN